MSSFWGSFLKKAEEESGGDLLGKSLLGAVAGGVSGAVAQPLSAMDHKMSPEEVDAYKNLVKSKRGISLNSEEVPFDLASSYDPYSETVRHPRKPRRGVFFHEMGHAKSLDPKRLRTKITMPYYFLGGAPILAGSLLPAALSGSDNELVQKVAPYSGALAVSPVLYEEAKASLDALKNIRKLHGNKSMLRAAPSLLAAYGSYLLPSLVSGYASKKYISSKKEASVANKFWSSFEKRAGLSQTMRSHIASGLAGSAWGGGMGFGMSDEDKFSGRLKSGLKGALVGGALGVGGSLYAHSPSFKRNYNYQKSYTGYSRPGGLKTHLSSIGATGKETTKKEVRRKFHEAALKNHPDRGGNEATMKNLNASWENIKNDPWFQKLALNVLKSVASKGRHLPPPIPGPKMMHGSSAAIPGQGAMVMGREGLKRAPQSIKSQGVGGMAVP